MAPTSLLKLPLRLLTWVAKIEPWLSSAALIVSPERLSVPALVSVPVPLKVSELRVSVAPELTFRSVIVELAPRVNEPPDITTVDWLLRL